MNPGSEGAAVSDLRRGDDAREDRTYLVPVSIAAIAVAAMVVVAAAMDLPIHDPDARYVGSPIALISLVVFLFFLVDVAGRAWRARRSEGVRLTTAAATVLRERWLNRRGAIVIACVVSFYGTYVSYRNLKSYVPVLTDGSYDVDLLELDRSLFFGHDPAELLHDLLGMGVAADVLSSVYVAFFMFIPLSLGFALIWGSRLRAGIWYTSALSLSWLLGALSYYVLPAMGPVYTAVGVFNRLPDTGVSRLQESLLEQRAEVLADPSASSTVQSIAAFASLHTAVIVAALLVAILLGLPRQLRVALWAFLALTITATIYFGWHYLIDDIAGAGIGVFSVWATGRLTGFDFSLRPAFVVRSQHPEGDVVGGH